MQYTTQDSLHLLEPRETTDNEEVICKLYKITSAYENSFKYRVEQLLALGCRRFNLEIGILSQVDGDNYEVKYHIAPESIAIADGDCFSLARTYCARTLASNGPVSFEHVAESNFANHPAYSDFGLESYIGTPVVVNNHVFGTLNFSSPNPLDSKFNPIDIDALQLMAAWLGGEISRNLAQIALFDSNERLLKAEAILAQVIEATPASIIMMNSTGEIVLVNQETERLFGYERVELLGQKMEMLLPEPMRHAHVGLRTNFSDKLDNRVMAGRDLYARKKSGEEFPVEVGLDSVQTEDQTWLLSAVIDLTDRKRYEEQIISQKRQLEEANLKLSTQANTDALTGLFNRRLFYKELENLLKLSTASSAPISLLLLDIDFFKHINDQYGHNKGDSVLKQLSLHLKEQARDSDLVARYGGEEFMIILAETNQNQANLVANRLCKSIELADYGCQLTVSIGATTINAATESVKTLGDYVEEADQALYASKQAGRNRVTHINHMA
jgi:diguanylate cyclase (GGDEF)-like protein/PAS domain S-box-containing protein